MQTGLANPVRWTTTDLAIFAGDRNHRYEIVDGELFVTRAPYWKHQAICINIGTELKLWSQKSGLGETAITPGIIFSDTDNVIPDVVWITHERLATVLDEAGHLTAAPELVVEVLSPGDKNERPDREAKLKLYSVQGVQEYWIFDPRELNVEIYRREKGLLKLATTLFSRDELASPLLPEFNCIVDTLF